MVIAQVQDLNVVVEFQQVAKLGWVLQAIELVISEVQLPQVHIHLQSSSCTSKRKNKTKSEGRKGKEVKENSKRNNNSMFNQIKSFSEGEIRLDLPLYIPSRPSTLAALPNNMSGLPERPAFSRWRTARLPLILSARATKGAEWSSRGVLRASR